MGTDATKPPIRVVHVVPSLQVGGAQRGVLELVQLLEKDTRFRVQLCVLSSRNEFYSTTGLATAPRFLRFSGRLSDWGETARCIRQLRAILRETNAAILHTHLWMADVLGGVAAKGLPLKHVCHLRDMRPWMASPHLRDHCRRFIYKALLAGSQTTCIAVSEAVRTYTCESLGWATEKIRVILNGIDTEEFFPAARPERPEVVVGGAGRFIHEKGFEFLIQAVGRLYRQGVPVRLRIAGEGSSRPAYEQLASELNFADRLELVERVTDMPSFYRNLDVFVMPSLEAEGLPRGILEAMASGVATVATATAGAPEVIRDGVNGLLVPAADASSLALAIERLARDPDLRKRLGHEGRNRIVKDFTLDRVYNQVVDQYMKVLHD